MDVAATWEPIGSLEPHPKNPRHNDAAVADVAESIRTFGFGAPIVARTADRVIIAGHTRWKAAMSLGLDKVPVRFMDLDPARAAALMLADNKLGELAEWDDALLSELAAEYDLDLTDLGWSDEEAAELLGAEAESPAGDPFADLPEEAPAFRQMTFTLTHDQHAEVVAALALADDAGPYLDTGNDNRNGNGLARLAEAYRG